MRAVVPAAARWAAAAAAPPQHLPRKLGAAVATDMVAQPLAGAPAPRMHSSTAAAAAQEPAFVTRRRHASLQTTLLRQPVTIPSTAAAATGAAAATAPPPVSHTQRPPARQLSNQPDATVYSGPVPQSALKRFTLRQLRAKFRSGVPLTMVTAYDYPSAVHVELAGIDVLLVGDSAAMVVHGHDTTLPITLDDMLTHCRAVARGARRPLLVGDLPFGCYEGGPADAVRSAVRMMKEGGMDAVKLEGGGPARIQGVRAVVEAGIAVMGHTGLMPQTISVMGGFRPQAQSAESALSVLRDAKALEEAGCFAVVLECVPAAVAAAVTAQLSIPTIGIGAGAGCSGQVLVYHDLLGMMQHPHHAKVTPKFCKAYAAVGQVVQQALGQYRDEVEARAFPGAAFSPYRISDEERAAAVEAARAEGFDAAAQALASAQPQSV